MKKIILALTVLTSLSAMAADNTISRWDGVALHNHEKSVEKSLERKGLILVESGGDYLLNDYCIVQNGGVLGHLNIAVDLKDRAQNGMRGENVIKAFASITDAKTGEVVAKASEMTAIFGAAIYDDCARAAKGAIKKLKFNH